MDLSQNGVPHVTLTYGTKPLVPFVQSPFKGTFRVFLHVT